MTEHVNIGDSHLSKQYLPLNHVFGTTPVVIYPAKDDGELTKVFDRNVSGCIEQYVDDVLRQATAFVTDADMILAVVWNQQEIPYCDVWKINRNHYSDDSGFLYDVHTYRKVQLITDMGVASGNTLIILTAEEMLLRDLILLQHLSFKEASNRSRYPAFFSAGHEPIESFYI